MPLPVVSVIDRMRNGPAPSLRISTEFEVADTSMPPGSSASVVDVVAVVPDVEPGARVVPGALEEAGAATEVAGVESSTSVVSGEVVTGGSVVDTGTEDETGKVVVFFFRGLSGPQAAATTKDATRTM